MNVLVVESGETTAELLRQAGHDVTVASSGSNADALTANGSFDAVVLGRSEPNERSLTLCEALRREGVALPIVLLVAGDGFEARIEGLEAGADDCVGIECLGDELLARLRAIVRRRSLQVEPG